MKIVALTIALAVVSPSTSAHAAIANLFGGDVPCTLQLAGANAGERHCSGIFTTFDGSPIDVNIGFPPAPTSGPDGDFPIVGVFHGWGGSKLSLTSSSMQQWLDKGYAVFSMSDRGWGSSCGGQDPKRLTPACVNGYNHLMDTRYEVRDAQEVWEALADQAADGATAGEGLIHPQQIASTGGSYGGGISFALGALKNRKMMGGGEDNGTPLDPKDGTLVPWMSPGGKAMAIAATQPDIPWSDLAHSLQPNGYTLDYVEDATYLHRGLRVGVLKQSFVSGLYGTGAATSNYAPTGSDPDADLNAWYILVNAGEPYDDNPQAADVIDELTRHHSAYYIDDSVAPAPMLISNGWTDDLFPPDEAIRFFNRTHTRHPGTPVAMMFTDHGHQRGQNKGPDGTFRNRQMHAWLDFYVRGIGAQPYLGVQTLTQTCGSPSGGATGDFDDPDTDLPFQATTWDGLAPGEVHVESAAAQVIAPDVPSDGPIAQAFDPITGGGACASTSSADQAGAATYRSDPAPAGGFTLMGSPTIVADILVPSPTSQIAARLLDVDPVAGTQTLVARGLYRPEVRPTTASCQVFQLHPNGWTFEEGHIAKLELLPDDSPYGRTSNGQTVITVENLRLRLPVLESPDDVTVFARTDKILPDGYSLAATVSVGVDTTSCVSAATTTTTSTTSTTNTTLTTTTTSTTTTTLPTEDLLVSRARIKAEKSAGAANGRIVVKGEFVVPPFFSSPPAFTVRIEDSSTLDTAHTFQDCDTSGNVQKARCRDRVAEGDFGVVLKARKNSNVIRVKVVFKRLSVSAPLAAPVTVSLLHNSAVVRADAIGNCKAKPGKLSCKQ